MPNCSERSEKGSRLFLLPQGDKNAERRKKWIINIKREGPLPKRAFVCEVRITLKLLIFYRIYYITLVYMHFICGLSFRNISHMISLKTIGWIKKDLSAGMLSHQYLHIKKYQNQGNRQQFEVYPQNVSLT